MKKRMICMCMAIAMLCTACQNTGRNETRDMREEIAETLKIASYDNLEILFDEMKYYDGQDLVIMEVQKYEVGEGSTYEETLEMTVEEIIPSLLEVEAVDRNKIYDLYSKVSDEENGAYYAKNYDAILASLDNYETIPELLYFDPETHTKFYYSSNWKSGVYISQGVLGTYADSDSPFGASGIIEDVKTYECRFDDLSDSYALLDGEKTVAEAKEEMESYLNAHYPIVELDNGFGNEVYEITAGKIAGTDYYGYKALRTIAYNGIPIREMPSEQEIDLDEFAFMGECAMCESDKLDVTIGLINIYEKPEIIRSIKEPISFSEIMDGVAHYLTGETKFKLTYGGLEYRMFYTDDTQQNYKMIPYWCFVAENPNDDTKIKIYVDMETGVVKHYAY